MYPNTREDICWPLVKSNIARECRADSWAFWQTSSCCFIKNHRSDDESRPYLFVAFSIPGFFYKFIILLIIQWQWQLHFFLELFI